MKENIYFDTSALAKWYLNEPRSEEVEEYIQAHGPVGISDLTVVEMRSLLSRRRREIDRLKFRDANLCRFSRRYPQEILDLPFFAWWLRLGGCELNIFSI